jgi:hypothetical protein
MTTPKEREQNQPAASKILDAAAGKNQSAREYLSMIAESARLLDDIYDGDYPITKKNLLEVLEILAIRIPTNKFYRQHQDFLLSQHLSMYNAWNASNEAEKGDELSKIYAHVWRDSIEELIPVVALLCKGPAHMKHISSIMRKVFMKQLGD